MMKSLARTLLLLITIPLMLAQAGLAQNQNQSGQDTDIVRSKIEMLEKADMKSKSTTVQDIYKRSLLRLYNQYVLAIKQDLKDLKNIEAATSGTGNETQSEVSAQIRNLTQEEALTTEKIQTLAGDVRAAISPADTNTSTPTTAETSVEATPVALPTSGSLRSRSVTRTLADSVLAQTPSPTPTPTPTPKEGDAPAAQDAGGGDANTTVKTLKVCGQVRPASLARTIALILNTPALENLTKYFGTDERIHHSSLGDDCVQDTGLRPGLQKEATIVGLKLLLENLNSDMTVKNNISTITVVPDPKRAANKELEFDIQHRSNANNTGKSGYSKQSPYTAGPRFSSLSLDTIKKQIFLLQEYTSNLAIHITNQDGNLIATGFTDQDGNYVIQVPINADDVNGGKYYLVSTEGDDYATRRKLILRAADIETVKPADQGEDKGDDKDDKAPVVADTKTNNKEGVKGIRVNLDVEDRPVSLLARATVGYEQAGASAAKKIQNYFFDLYISKSIPFKQKIDPDFGERARMWGDIRLSSIPQSGETTIADIGGTAKFAQQVSGLKLKDAAQVLEFIAGFEYRLAGNNALLPSFDRQTKQKFSLSLIAGFGTITPVNPQDTISVFKVFNDAPGLPPEAKGKDFVAFVSSDRDRFFRQYYAGFRLQTFFFNRNNMPMQRFPAQLDVTYGQNEFVSGGHLRGGVFRLEGYYPLPYEDLKFINLFGTALLRPGRAHTSFPLILEAAPAGTTVPAANVALVETPQFNRDYYKAGFGIDFISFVQSLKKMGNK